MNYFLSKSDFANPLLLMNSPMLDEWVQEQVEGRAKVITVDDFSVPLELIGGLDISFVDQSDALEEYEAVGALVVLKYSTLEVVYTDCIEMKTSIPYVSGFLGFREEPFAEILFKRICSKAPEFIPQVLFVDGCGIYHPRHFGSASQIGLKLNIPTIGISKSFLKLAHLEEQDFKLNNLSGPVDLPVISGSLVAMALYTGTSKHPRCYVSIGHRISLSAAIEITKKCSVSKIPEPIRQADLISREYIRSNHPICK